MHSPLRPEGVQTLTPFFQVSQKWSAHTVENTGLAKSPKPVLAKSGQNSVFEDPKHRRFGRKQGFAKKGHFGVQNDPFYDVFRYRPLWPKVLFLTPFWQKCRQILYITLQTAKSTSNLRQMGHIQAIYRLYTGYIGHIPLYPVLGHRFD